MKKAFIFIFLLYFSLHSKDYKEVLLDACEFRGYRMEIKQLKKKDKKKCYLYLFKKQGQKYSFYRSYDLLIDNAAYFVGYYNLHGKRYNKKGDWYIVKEKKKNRKFKVYFHDFEENYKNSKNLQYYKLTKDVLGTLRIIGGEEILPKKELVTKAFGSRAKYLPKAFYGNRLIEITLMKDGSIGIYKKNGFLPHVRYSKYKIRKQPYFEIAHSHAGIINSKIKNKYPKVEAREPDKSSICPQITPPKEYQKPMLKAKIKPYKNLAGNKME